MALDRLDVEVALGEPQAVPAPVVPGRGRLRVVLAAEADRVDDQRAGGSVVPDPKLDVVGPNEGRVDLDGRRDRS